ncbi:MAG: hypothetical protein RL701_4071 [Pseudomonadota bacterium]
MATRRRSYNPHSWLCLLGVWTLASVAHAHDPGLDKPLPALHEYLSLGVEHILTGYDHLAFLLGITLLAQGRRALLLCVTGFTLAHSCSLGLSVLGILAPPSQWVETIIALSIAYVAVENLLGRRGRYSFAISFGFGFVHGFGFAGALQEIGMPPGRAPAALALFNLGVELGQLAVLMALLPLLAWLRTRPRTWHVVARTLHVALFVLGVGWAVERTLQAPASAAPGAESAALLTPLAAAGAAAPTGLDAEELCLWLTRMPRERRARCAGRPVGVTLERACARSLSAAFASGALTLAAEARTTCLAQQRAQANDCSVDAAAVSCSDLWRGQRVAGASCRSSLECADGLYCSGVLGPVSPGVCAAPKAAGAACGEELDALTVYLPRAEQRHAECTGRCEHARCQN